MILIRWGRREGGGRRRETSHRICMASKGIFHSIIQFGLVLVINNLINFTPIFPKATQTPVVVNVYKENTRFGFSLLSGTSLLRGEKQHCTEFYPFAHWCLLGSSQGASQEVWEKGDLLW